MGGKRLLENKREREKEKQKEAVLPFSSDEMSGGHHSSTSARVYARLFPSLSLSLSTRVEG